MIQGEEPAIVGEDLPQEEGRVDTTRDQAFDRLQSSTSSRRGEFASPSERRPSYTITKV